MLTYFVEIWANPELQTLDLHFNVSSISVERIPKIMPVDGAVTGGDFRKMFFWAHSLFVNVRPQIQGNTLCVYDNHMCLPFCVYISNKKKKFIC